MTHRERTLAVLHDQPYDRLPVVHFGYWNELLAKWADEGHLTHAEAAAWDDGNAVDTALDARLGFDANWAIHLSWNSRLFPPLETGVVEVRGDGSRVVFNRDGVHVVEKEGVVSIPSEIDHLLKGRREWNEIFKPRLQWTFDRVDRVTVTVDGASAPFAEGGLALLRASERRQMVGLWAGSMIGVIRDWLGLVGMSYLMADDERLFDEMVETVGELNYRGVQAILETGARFDFAHLWEDIAYKGGPLVSPRVFASKIAPQYRRITDLLHSHGIDIVSLDCDGKIDLLVPIWLNSGINTMFPIEVGTWGGSIAPWRERYGRRIRGVGGVRKTIFAQGRGAIDAEIERLKPLVEMGGYIPCPDHRLPIETEWEDVRYYCERMRVVFSG